MIIYEAVVSAVSLLRKKVKWLTQEYMNEKGQVVNTILYYSTNTSRDAIDAVRYYKARFQMEFIFRDA